MGGMGEMERFITKINIKKVRHLIDVEIKLSDNEKKHLILTGKNGSGKTSVLEALTKFLKGIENGEIYQFNNYDNLLTN